MSEQQPMGPESEGLRALVAATANKPAGARAMSLVVRATHSLSNLADCVHRQMVPADPADDYAPQNVARRPILIGLWVVILFFGVFGLWSVLAPISSAAIAPGKVILDSNVKSIEHLEGGIVDEILVREGQTVKAGDVLVRLDNTAAKARYDLLRGQYVSARASEGRLLAERDNLPEIRFAEDLLGTADSDPNVADNLDSQRRLFASRRESLIGRTDVLTQKIKQSEEEINGLRQQVSSGDRQMALLNSEISDVQYLLKSGNAAKTRLLALQRRKAEIEGERGQRKSLIARAEQTIGESKIEIFNLKTNFLNEVVAELKETQTQLSDLQEQMRAAKDVVRRIEIMAPIGGEVTGLKTHTVGGVIAPGEPLMEIVPSDDVLIVEARVRPQDIDAVRAGLPAHVRLLAFKVRNIPPVAGKVSVVSADRFEDERSGEAYFTVRVTIKDSALSELENVKLSAGMPVEVLIVTGKRTFMGYLLSPISEAFTRAFREK